MKSIIIFICFVKLYGIKQFVKVIPEEVGSPEQKYISEDINYVKQGKIDFGDEILRYNGRLYYKDPFAYYGPKETYKSVYEEEKESFVVNLLLKRPQL
jgi:hypothetical protein